MTKTRTLKKEYKRERNREKKQQRVNHVKLRAWERYGIKLNARDRREIERNFTCGELLREDDRGWIVKLPYKGKELVVVIGKRNQKLITVLPKEAGNANGCEAR